MNLILVFDSYLQTALYSYSFMRSLPTKTDGLSFRAWGDHNPCENLLNSRMT